MEKIKKVLKSRKFLACLIILLFIPLIATFARYVTTLISDYYLELKHFYFNSDKLSSEHPTYQINNWTGVDMVEININMDSKKNELQFSDMDIDYEIEYLCEEGVTCSLSKTEGIIRSNSNEDSFSLKVIPNRNFSVGESTTVNIFATSKSPYVKKIGARFIITSSKQGVSYEIVDKENQPYLMFNITNSLSYYTVKTPFGSYQAGQQISEKIYKNLTDAEKNNCISATITLSFDPNIVLLDTTNKVMHDVINQTSSTIGGQSYLSGVTFNVPASSSTALRFYKKNKQQNYTYPVVNENSIINFSVN